MHKRVEQHESLHAFALANCALLTSEHVEQIENPVLKKIAGKLMERPTLGADSLNGTSPFPDAQDDDV